MARPTAKVYKQGEVIPQYAAEVTHGVPIADGSVNIPVDAVDSCALNWSPNLQEHRYAGGTYSRVGGIIRAGLDLGFSVRNIDFINKAIRLTTGTWAYMGSVPSMTMFAGNVGAAAASSDLVKFLGCKVNTLELSQEYDENGAPLAGSVSVMSLAGESATYSVFPEASHAQYHTKMSYHGNRGLTYITSPVGPFYIRSWRLNINNNLQYVDYGDTTRQVGRSSYIREAYELREGEEEFTFECSVEVPITFSVAANDNFSSDVYAPGSVAAQISYADTTDNAAARYVKATLQNICMDNDYGFQYEYDASGMQGDPIRVYSMRMHKENPLLQCISGTGLFLNSA